MSNKKSEEINSEVNIKQLPSPPSSQNLYRIPITITKHNSRALLDTGAAASFFNCVFRFWTVFSQIAPKVVQNVTTENSNLPQFKTASGTLILPLGYYSAPVTIGNLTIPHPFYVVPHLEENWILGLDFITKNRVKINGRNNSLTITKKNNKNTALH